MAEPLKAYLARPMLYLQGYLVQVASNAVMFCENEEDLAKTLRIVDGFQPNGKQIPVYVYEVELRLVGKATKGAKLVDVGGVDG